MPTASSAVTRKSWDGFAVERPLHPLDMMTIIVSVSRLEKREVVNAEAKERFPNGWKTLKPYLRLVAQPS